MSYTQSNRPPPKNKQSALLTPEENDILSQVCEKKKCVILAIAIAQVYKSTGMKHERWTKQYCGAVCFIKDNRIRSFFIRVYDFEQNQFVWEQELFAEFTYSTPRTFFHTFEADECQAGVNFASEDEANSFGSAIEGKLKERRQKREEKRRNQNRGIEPPKYDPQIPSAPGSNGTYGNTLKNIINKGKKGKREKKLTKADISSPTNFVHVQHVGWNPNTGFNMENVDDSFKSFLKDAGVSERDFQDDDTRNFIYDFIERHGGIDAVKEERQREPPSVPARDLPPTPPQQKLGAPPAPPVRNTAPLPPVPHGVSSRGTAPLPPTRGPSRPPQSSHIPAMGGAPPPPPPPPPPADLFTSGGPPPQLVLNGGGSGGATQVPNPPVTDSRSALMEQIRKGAQLHHVDPETESISSTPDARGALLDQIRHGIELKSVQDLPKATAEAPKLEGLAGALARALQERAKAYHGDADDSDSSDDELDEDDDEWGDD